MKDVAIFLAFAAYLTLIVWVIRCADRGVRVPVISPMWDGIHWFIHGPLGGARFNRWIYSKQDARRYQRLASLADLAERAGMSDRAEELRAEAERLAAR